MRVEEKPENIAIVGAGIGGLAAALALSRQGYSIDLFEQVPGFSEVGAGLQLSPNAVKALQSLELTEALRLVAFEPEGLEIRHWKSGRSLATESLGERAVARWGAPYYHVHRADLHGILLEAVLTKPDIRLHNDARCTGIEQTPDCVHLTFASGSRHRTDLLIGADGIHSVVREKLWGPDLARFTGNVAWRLLIPSERLPQNLIKPVATIWMGPDAHFVHYYVREGDEVNCVCVEEQSHWDGESWIEPGDKTDLKAAFAGWHENIQTLIDATDADNCYRWALFDRKPMPQWGEGRITLLGDACHPTLPFLAQGACMAIEDAVVLGKCLSGSESRKHALQKYEQLRKARTARAQRVSHRNGRIYHMKGPLAVARNMVLRSGLASPNKTMDWLYDYDAGGAG